MTRTSVSIRSGVFSEDAQEISSQYFGGNMLFDRDRVGEEGTYDEKAEALNLSLIRYPGGNVTEIFFDIADPDKSVEELGHSGSLMPLSEFLDYINTAGLKASFVAPTVPFMNALATDEMSVAEVRSEMRAFLVELKNGVYGDPSNIEHIEIGNEYYGYEKFFDWSAPGQYAELAPIWAEEIREVFGDSVKIAVQGGANNDDNALFLEAFAGKGDLVDSVIYHSYPWNLGQVYSHDRWKTWLSDQWEKAGVTDKVFMSEWGISNQRLDADGQLIGTDKIEDGLARAIAMVEMAALQIKSGVDYATVWPVQQNTRGDLGGNEGQTADNAGHFLSEDSLTVAGEAFQMMAETLPGMRLLDIGGAIDLDGKAESDRYAPEVLLRAFEDDAKIVIFLSAWALDPALGGAGVDLAIGSNVVSYDVATLTVAGGNYLDANADPISFEETGLTPDDGISVSFTRDYELKRITLYKDAQVDLDGAHPALSAPQFQLTLVGEHTDDRLVGDDAMNGMFGRGGDDYLHGGGDMDWLDGGRGADRLYGGDGFDFLRGGGGSDSLFGGAGDDSLVGAGQDDRLNGQGGADTLRGGGGDDTLLGGRAEDALYGGGGGDFMKGGDGDDIMIGGGGRDRLFGNAGDDVLSGKAGADRLFGGEGDDTLNGGAGRDVLELGPGEDVATGGSGADMFIIRPSAERATIADFQIGEDNIMFLAANRFQNLTFSRDGQDAIVSAGGVELLIEGVAPNQLSAGDFIF